ncbi:MAG: hypothetical protein HY868_15340 [Chloroflexi bacterium]|nr:hypothetical protein [Chloroflexota bacterium]
MANRRLPPLTQTRVLTLAKIRRERVLPVNGEVLVTMGSRVGALDVVARAASVGFLRPVPLARYMHTTETTLPSLMKKQVGDDIVARDEIASKPEFFGAARRVYRAPGNGRITALQGSWLTMDLMDAPFELRGHYRGAIVNIVPRRGVVIEANGALAEGTWGTGSEAYGILRKAVDAPGSVLTDEQIDVSARGAILLAGAGITETALQRAAQEQAAGLIIGSISAKIKSLLVTLSLPVMVTEGFGEIPMALPIFEMLARHSGEEAFLDAKMPNPEIFIPALSAAVSGETAQVPATLSCEIGATVRITSGPLIGQVGKIADAPALPQVLESGISVWGAEVELLTGSRAFVPWENLELIG